MSKIAVMLKNNIVDNVVISSPDDYKDEEGWTLVDSDPTFSIENKLLWTVRESDNKLVHVSTGKTPDEETKDSIAELTKMGLDGQLNDAQVQAAITSLTKQNLQLTQDNVNFKTAFTTLTQEYADLKLQLSNTSAETNK